MSLAHMPFPPERGAFLDDAFAGAARAGAGDAAGRCSPDPAQLTLWPEASPRPAAGSETHRRARRATWTRRTLALLAGAGLVATLRPAPAHALFGIPGLPQIVYDPAAVARLITQVNQMAQLYSTARAHANAFVANTRRLTSAYAWRDPSSAVSTVDALVTSGQALSYSTAGLAGQLATTFPGYSYNPVTAAAANRTQRERALSTSLQQLMAAQATGVQLGQSIARLRTMKQQLATAGTSQQVAELSATIAVLQAEETTLLRQQLLAQQSGQAVYQADQANRELQGAAAVQRLFLAPARALTVTPPVRPTVNPATYVF